jgi:hypothetical protein
MNVFSEHVYDVMVDWSRLHFFVWLILLILSVFMHYSLQFIRHSSVGLDKCSLVSTIMLSFDEQTFFFWCWGWNPGHGTYAKQALYHWAIVLALSRCFEFQWSLVTQLFHFLGCFLCTVEKSAQMLEISGCCCNHRSEACSKADGQGKIYFCRMAFVCLQLVKQANTHRMEERPLFLSLPKDCLFALKEEAQVHSFCDWLRLRFRGGHRGRADMIREHRHET